MEAATASSTQPDPARWDNLTSSSMYLAELSWSREIDRYHFAKELLELAIRWFPEGPSDEDMAVHTLARGLLDVLRSVEVIER